MRHYEAAEQAAVFRWAQIQSKKSGWEFLQFMYHIPNGGSRNKIEAANLKRQGVRSGVPDIHLAVARSGYNSLYIEMKHGRNRVTANQKIWIDGLRGLGNAVAVCYSADEAIDVLQRYASGGLGMDTEEMRSYGSGHGRKRGGGLKLIKRLRQAFRKVKRSITRAMHMAARSVREASS